MFFLNYRYYIDQTDYQPFESIISEHGLDYFASEVKIIIFFSHRWVDSHVADNGDCFAECKNQVDQIIKGFADQPENLKYFGFFFDYSCIPQAADLDALPKRNSLLKKLKRLLLMELYQTLTQSTTLYLCRSNSGDYYNRIWIVMELLIALHRGIEQIPTYFRSDPNLARLALLAQQISTTPDHFQFVIDATHGLECTEPEDKIATQSTLYRYVKTKNTGIPIEIMNMAIFDIHAGLRSFLMGDTDRLENHVSRGLENWEWSIEDMGFDEEYQEQLRQYLRFL